MATDALKIIDDAPVHGLGHNRPPLRDRLFADEDATVSAVLAAVLERIREDRKSGICEVSARAKILASNSKRLPSELDETSVAKALDLLADIGIHCERAAEEKDRVVSDAKSVTDALNSDCKPLEAGLQPVEKALRPLLVQYLTRRLAEHNSSLAPGDAALTTITARGSSGARATLTMDTQTTITDPSAVPRDLCVPDMALVEKAIAEGRDVPGIEMRDSPALRVYK